MVSAETLLSYPDWKLLFTVPTDASNKQLCAVIIQNNKPIAFFSRKLSKPRRNYTTTDKELLAIAECFKQFRGIIFGYEINAFSDHKNLVYAATLSESQRVMRWQLIIKEFGPNIQHIAGVDNIVDDTLSRLTSTPSEKNESCTRKAQCRANELFAISRKNNDNCFPLKLLIVHREQQKELRKINYNLSTYILDQGSGYSMQRLDDADIICYNSKIYVPQSLCRRVLD